ncbi:MAG: DUF4412 domain-containing protein [Bacteroidetes bacterium]|jgi:hypothetical protein|nr:DUF4412 domain-containing protein [Bacteroidota bacterium]
MLRKIIALLILTLGFSAYTSAQNFEGIIEFKKQIGTTSTDYVYYVKGDKVRIDEFSPGTRTVDEIFILDTKANTFIYLNSVRKQWGMRVTSESSVAPAGCIASTTKATKEIFGYKCAEQLVTNEKDNTQISFFVAPGKFAFFAPMVKLMNQQENFSTYLMAVALKDGSMPLLAVEKDLNGLEKGRLEVTRLEQKVLAGGLFEIPKDYTEVK